MSKDNIPQRKDVPNEYKWDLSQIFKSDDEWEAELKNLPKLTEELEQYKNKLSQGKDVLLNALKAYEKLSFSIENLYHYAHLIYAGDQGDSLGQDKYGRIMLQYTDATSRTSFFVPELISIPDEEISKYLEEDDFKDYKIFIQKILHTKPYILSEKEERIIALSENARKTASNTFDLLTDVDMNFGTVKEDGKEMPLTQGTFVNFLESNNRETRKEAYEKFYKVFESHASTLASLYSGSIQDDIFNARARGYNSSLEASLYEDKIPVSVYKNLIETVHNNLDTLHRYYSIRKKILKLDELRHYDVYVPLVNDVKSKISYEESVEICRNALSILGKEYTDTLCSGLLSGWTDRYENKGKASGAFSSGCYKGYPYILLNYKDTSLKDVYTMAHEGGHSMHSYYSTKNNPYMSYEYTIFEAEVASTFNEELIYKYLLKNSSSKEMKLYLLSNRAHDIVSTLYRQTMFAEFELIVHELAEKGEALSTDVLRSTYRKLLELYFGSEMKFETSSDLEGLRIPHFYNAFYVYKYATGISAALALANKVATGNETDKENYFKFLKSGGSRYPLESLKLAGIDMESPKPIQDALDAFKEIVNQLEKELLN